MPSEKMGRLRVVPLRLVYYDDLCLRFEERYHLPNGFDKNPLALKCGNDEAGAASRHRLGGQRVAPTWTTNGALRLAKAAPGVGQEST